MQGLSIKEVSRRTSLCRSVLYALIQEGRFPKPAKVGRRSIWSSDSVDSWLRARFDERDQRKAVR